jgi:hypothetical protein
MNSSDRLKAMYVIWGAFAFAAGFSFAGNQETGTNDLWLAVIFAVAAVVGSVVVMRLNIVNADDSAQAHKPKRSSYNLVDDLDERELADLRRRLAALDNDSSEAAPLGDLMQQEQRQSR